MIDKNGDTHCDWCGEALPDKRRFCEGLDCLESALEEARERKAIEDAKAKIVAQEVHELRSLLNHHSRRAEACALHASAH